MDRYFPPKEALLELEPEEIAQYLLFYLNSLANEPNGRNKFNRGNNISAQTPAVLQYAGGHFPEIEHVLSEAWSWLESEGFLVEDPQEYTGNWVFISRRGRQIGSPEEFKRYEHIKLLPKKVLDPQLAQKIWASFIRGDFEVAIFTAFKEVEVRVRQAAGLTPQDIGVALARKAFNPTNGPLTDLNIPDTGERQAHMELFSGALGAFKNPSSHRDVDYNDPIVATSLILHANTLLKIIESRTNTNP